MERATSILRAFALLLALAAPAARAQSPVTGPVAIASPTAASAPAAASAPVLIPGAPPGVAIHVTVGLGGLVTWQDTCVPVLIDVTAQARRFEGVVRLRTDEEGSHVFEIPVSAEPGARRRLHEVACPTKTGRWQWSLDGDHWEDPSATVTPDIPIVPIIGPDVGALGALEEAVGGTPSQPGSPTRPERTAVLAADEVPTDAAGWAAAPVVLLDAVEAQKLTPEAVTALHDHVLAGGTLIVAGTEDPGLPPSLQVARPAEHVSYVMTDGQGAKTTVDTLSLETLPGAEPITSDRFTEPWAVRRLEGHGRIVRLGLDLHVPVVREFLNAEAWLELCGFKTGSMAKYEISVEPDWMNGVKSAFDADQSIRATATIVPPAAAALALLVAAIGLGAGAWMLKRAGRAGSRRDLALVLGALCVPGFALGLFRSTASVQVVTIHEAWPQAGRERVLRWTPIAHDGTTDLVPGVQIGDAKGTFGNAFPTARFRLGDPASVHLATLPRFMRAEVVTVSWADATPDAMRQSMTGTDIARVATGAVTVAPNATDSEKLTSVAQAAIAGGVLDAHVGVARRHPGDPVTVWILHEGTP